LTFDDNNFRYWLDKGKENFRHGKWEKAIEFYDKTIELDRNVTQARIDKCVALNFLGRYNEALDHAREALEIDPKNSELLAVEGESLNFLGRYNEALDRAREALEINRENDYALYVKGYALDYSGKHKEAVKLYDQAIERYKDADYFISKGIAHNYLTEYRKAIECFGNALNILQNICQDNAQQIAYAYINKGESHFRLKEYIQSARCYHNALEQTPKAIANNPTDSHAWTFQGICYFRLGWYERATRCFDKVIEKINPEFDLAWYHKGYALDYAGKHDEAIKYYGKAIKLNHNDADYWTSKGIAHYDLEDYDKAIECFQEAVHLDPSYVIDYIKIGECEYRKKKYRKALQIYDEKVENLQYNSIKYYDMGLCHYQLSSYREAEEDYLNAIKAAQREAEDAEEDYLNAIKAAQREAEDQLVIAYYNLGVLYHNKIKQEESARQMFKKCLETNPTFSKAKEAIDKIDNNSQSEWFRWWFGHENVRRVLGLFLMFLIPAIILAVTTVIVYKQQITSETMTAITVLVGFLVLIMLLPSIRRFKVSEIEIETIEITAAIKQELEPALFPKLKYTTRSY
jgi:tetratricopeptide (TPR) repeat protein